jgi:hypothetical protein
MRPGKTEQVLSAETGMGTLVAAIKASRIEDERRKQEWEEGEHRRKERGRNAALESKRIETIERYLGIRCKRQEVLGYVTAVREKLEAAEYEDPDALCEWITWAEDHAAGLNPLRRVCRAKSSVAKQVRLSHLL